MIRCNFHMHSKNSDGKKTVKEIFEMMENDNVEIFSITDHDTFESQIIANEIKNDYKIKYINGIEFSGILTLENSGFNKENTYIHLLAYNYDLDKMLKIIGNKDISKNRFKDYEVIELVHKCNGFVIFAHPYELVTEYTKPTISDKSMKDIVNHLKENNIDGFELYYGNYNKEIREKIKKAINSNDYIYSVGSDYHGTPHRKELHYMDIDNIKIEKLLKKIK